ncbi:MAG: mechanosensitive ion channel [Planctomycetota bacterium]|nr:mechanosensitive ion channel [Planctomycetota bacterium]
MASLPTGIAMRASLLLGTVLLASGFLAMPVGAQDSGTPGRSGIAVDELSLEALEADLKRTRADDTLDAEEVEAVVEKYQQALLQVQRRNEWNSQYEEDVRFQGEAPGLLKAMQGQRDSEPSSGSPIEVPGTASFTQLEQWLAESEADLDAAQALTIELELEHRGRIDRRSVLPAQLSEARGQLADVEGELAALQDKSSDSELYRAIRLSIRARRSAIEAEVRAYEQEVASLGAHDELLNARRTQVSRRVTQADRRVKAWREKVNERRRLDSEADGEAAQRALVETARDLDILKPLADDNSELAAQRRDNLGVKIEQTALRLDEVSAALALQKDRFASVEAKYNAAGGTPTIGLLLKDHRDSLVDIREYRATRELRIREQGDIELQKIGYDEQAEALVNLDRAVAEFIDEQLNPPMGEDRATLESSVREQLQIRQGILSALLADYRTYIHGLIDLSIVEKELIDETEQFAAYIDERVLWVRIAPPLHTGLIETWEKTKKAIGWLFDSPSWGDLMARVPRTVRQDPLGTASPLVFILLLVFTRPLMRRRIADDAYLLGRIRTDRFTHTVRTTILTILLASGTPLVIWFGARLIEESAGTTLPLGRDVAAGLGWVAAGYFVGELIWAVCRRRGLAEAHFRWPVASLKLLRRHVRWLMLFGLPVLFILGALQAQGNGAYSESLGRLAFMAGQLMLAIFAYQVLRPTRGVLRFVIERHTNSWTNRLRYFWFSAAIGMPIMLFGLATLGYLYTAQQLQIRVLLTGFIIVGFVFIHALLMRWLFVARRQLGLQQHRKRRAAAQAEAATSGSASEEYVEDEDIDIPSVSAQSRSFVKVLISIGLIVGVLLVWADVLPALNFFDEQLWTHTYEVDVDGDTTTKVDAITLRDLVVALATLLITIAAARNLPGLLEIAILQRLPLQRAGRYAITTISRYLISVIGISLMFGSVGIGWETVQWLAAAMFVGLGFGLQEIFANFVSGLILLFERPIRVGDTVTVGDVTGSVTRIHMRATTLVTWDRTELIVPNREFITNQLVNWTLTDSVLRVIVKVGIAYGSDTKKAEELLRKVAAEQPDVLDEPKPRVVFTQFGDSTLDFELRVFVTDPELFRTISHPINNAIDREFKAAGIEIAFPQRDLHIRTSSAVSAEGPQEALVNRPG